MVVLTPPQLGRLRAFCTDVARAPTWSTRRNRNLKGGRGPARGCLEEAVGERLFRAKAKRREAYAAGKSAGSDEARYSSVPRG